ncbi:MAG TPA: ribosome small subunit-dependent GTPase A [Verrucomicrobiales bacterium]|nr:ribosome small subunit-dependent GTPase A [Verrucomicrobiales bacterium]
MTLEDLGWNEAFAERFAPFAERGLIPARLVRETKINFSALLDGGEEIDCVLGGKVWHEAVDDADLPAVGDWVALDKGGEGDEVIIRERLPRVSRFSRKMPGKSAQEQVLAANVDIVVVVTDPGPDFSPRRMERYLTLIERCGARPVVLLNKADLFPEKHCMDAVSELRNLSRVAEIHVTSAWECRGLDVLRGYLQPGVTITLVGSSGVGKSTLVNQLLGGEWQETSEVNEVTGRGRHTTSHRELVALPEGGLLIDNPGVREIQMWTDEETLRESFADVEDLSARCRFTDCKHEGDAGCAIQLAVEEGSLDLDRYQSYLILEEEIEELNRRRQKRRMATERWAKRNRRVKARNLADRIELEKEERGEA